nr:cytochrome P450 3A6-like [Dermacentor andersoni]
MAPNSVSIHSDPIFLAPLSRQSRCADEDHRCGKYLIKKGTSVVVPTYHLHHDPRHWEEPEKFKPERFSPENKHLINSTAYHPFGLGPRMCVGSRLALLELASVTSQVLRQFKITLAPRQNPDLELTTYSFLGVPKESVKIYVQRLCQDK